MLSLLACQSDPSSNVLQKAPISVQWELIENGANAAGNQRQLARYKITNTSSQPLTNNWAIYFNQVNEPIVDSVRHNGLTLTHINGDFLKIYPAQDYAELAAGETIVLEYEGKNWSIKNSDTPKGMYFVFKEDNGKEGTPLPIKQFDYAPFIASKQIHRNASDSFPIPDATFRFQQQQGLSKLAKEALLPIIPTPQEVEYANERLTLTNEFTLCYPKSLANERSLLLQSIEQFGLKIKDYQEGDCQEKSIQLVLRTGPILQSSEEAYQLTINAQTEQITIEGTDKAGIFYGIQSLVSLLPWDQFSASEKDISLPALTIKDAPRFPYRGLHIDVSRNFQSKQSVLKMLDLMGHFKLNKFHFHLTDDEGWRLEIPDLPELTTVGGRRGHTLDELDHLQPAYGSGPSTDGEAGNGYFSKADYIDILKYAKARHIEVIPEIDLPGHARAAIKAMVARQHTYANTSKEEADQYVLHDPEDASTYRSAQGYTDNTTCVCRESLYSFIDKVVAEIHLMHEEADHPLTTIHTGGDEVPDGVWEGSPICQEFLKEHPEIEPNKEGLTKYFLQRFHQILDKRKLITGGWEEIALQKELRGEYPTNAPNPSFINSNFQPYVWNAVFGWGGEDIAYQLANKGYPVVLCNASNLYFDLAYDKAPEVEGLYWAGFIDTKKAYEFVPFNLFQTAQMDRFGAVLDPIQLAKGKVQLTEAGKKNILGIQGQLWSETLYNSRRLEESTFPKLLGLAERAWAAQPTWATTSTPTETFNLLDKDWNHFANTIGQWILPRLNHLAGGIQYHIPPPGGMIENGQLVANTAYPGLEIRYTKDGKEPTINSPLYKEPIAVNETIRLKAFCGKNSSFSMSVIPLEK